MAIIRTIALSITARTDGLTRGLAKAEASVSRFAGGLKLAAGLFSGVTLARAFVRGIEGAVDQADALVTTAQGLQLATDKLRGLQVAAKLTNIESETLHTSLAVLATNLSKVADGAGGEAGDALKKLKIDAKSILSLDLDEQFLAIADAMAGIPNVSDRIRVTRALFGRGGAALLPMIGGGGAELRAQLAMAQQMGLTLRGLPVAKLEQVGDAFTILKFQAERLWITLGVELAPALIATADAASYFLGKLSEGAQFLFQRVPRFLFKELPLETSRLLLQIPAAIERAAGDKPGLANEWIGTIEATLGKIRTPPPASMPFRPYRESMGGDDEDRPAPRRLVRGGEISPFVDLRAMSRVETRPSPQLEAILRAIREQSTAIIGALRASRVIP